jgi:hypothetical protein
MATSVGTTVSVWQPDTTGQTASGALGAWLLIVTWLAMERARRGEDGWRWPALVSALTVAGLFTRELFVGWAVAAAALAIGAHLAWRGRPSRTATARLVLPLILLPAVFVVLRLTTGGMALVTEIEPAYSPRLGANIARNVVLGVASVTATGPTHAVLTPGFPRWQAAVAVASILVTIALVALPWLRDPRHAPPLSAWSLVAVLSAGGLLVALPLESMSEHYGFGPNLGVAALVGAATAYVWQRGRGRAILTALLLAGLVAGVVGTVSRAAHFASSWQQARELNTAVLDALERHEGDVLLSLPACTAEGPRYNVYILPPAELYSVGQSEYFLDHADPTRRIRIEVGSTDPDASPSMRGWETNGAVSALNPRRGGPPGCQGRTRPPRLGRSRSRRSRASRGCLGALGHSSVAFTMDTYEHLMPNDAGADRPCDRGSVWWHGGVQDSKMPN